MYLSVLNRPKSISRKEVIFATQFFANLLMRSRINKSLLIIISFEDILDCKAEVYQHPEDNRQFIITIRKKLSRQEILKALAHEMVHVMQFATGKMKDMLRPLGKTKFDGKLYDYPETMDEYWFKPWEVEAYGLEVALYQSYRIMKKKELKK